MHPYAIGKLISWIENMLRDQILNQDEFYIEMKLGYFNLNIVARIKKKWYKIYSNVKKIRATWQDGEGQVPQVQLLILNINEKKILIA